jgi:hypothetical protein
MDTNLKPHQPILPARRLRIIVVSEVRFLREGLAEILERDPTVSVVGLSADLPENGGVEPCLAAGCRAAGRGVSEGRRRGQADP